MRIAVARKFVGQGVFAILGKKDWIGWFAKFGVSDPELAKQLLLAVGLMDLAVAAIVLLKPIRAILLWTAICGFRTALLNLSSACRSGIL